MKNSNISERAGYALSGIAASLRSERSFRTEAVCFLLVVVVLGVTRPAPIWWAILILACGCVLTTELINTAVEKLADHLSPDIHPAIKIVKDTLAGAVFVICATAALVLAAFFIAILTQ